MAKKFDEGKKEFAYSAQTIEEHEIWRDHARAKLIEISGISQCQKAPLLPILVNSSIEEGYVKESWTIQTEPGVVMPFYFLKPTGNNCRATMIVPHGHGSGKEATIGNRDNPGVRAHAEWLEKSCFALELVRNGYNVVCPDARGTGERREFVQQGDTAENWCSNSHRELLQIAIGFGQSIIGLFTWDLMKLVDFLCTRPEVNSERIGCAGMSGGGQQTLWLSMLDERIKVAVTSGYFYGMKESLLLLPHNCACNFVPNIWKTVDMGDMGALIAPRAFLVETGEKDPLNGKSGLKNVLPQFEITRKAYQILHAEDRLHHSIHQGGHVWDGKDVMLFLEKWL